MLRNVNVAPSWSWTYRAAPVLVATGLVMLSASMAWPAVPPVTGMALAALGATAATIERFRGTPLLPLILFANLAIYGGLYALFVGAELSLETVESHHLGWPMMSDLALSTLPMVGAVGIGLDAVRKCASAE